MTAKIALRRVMLYPPFFRYLRRRLSGEDEAKTQRAAGLFFERLRSLLQTEYAELPLRVLGPSAAAVAKVSNKFRYKLILKHRNSARFREMLSRLLAEAGRDRAFRASRLCRRQSRNDFIKNWT